MKKIISDNNNICSIYTNHCINNITNLPRKKVIIAKSDSGATSHFIREEDAMCLTDIVDANGPDISLPDNSTLTATKKGILPLPAVLSTQARTASIVPGLNNSSLLSVPQLCDDGCDVLFRREKMYAVKDKKVVLSGTRNYRDRLWDVPLPYDYPVQKTVMQE